MLARRDALRRTRQRPDGCGQRPDRHQAGGRTRRDAPGALFGAPQRAPPGAGELARCLPCPGVAKGGREQRARLDLRLQHRSGRRPGPRPVRRGGADRRGTLPGARVGAIAGRVPRGAVGDRQSLADGADRLVEAELPMPEEWKSVALELPDGSAPCDPGARAARSRSCSTSRCGATRSTTSSVASTAARCSTTPGTATGSKAAR